jgi:hypothetical protein
MVVKDNGILIELLLVQLCLLSMNECTSLELQYNTGQLVLQCPMVVSNIIMNSLHLVS